MDKNIIIDGVDVAGCEFYKIYPNSCKDNPNCYYKQIRRLAQENEELKHRCEVYHQCDEMIKNTYGQAHKEAMRLTKENEKLKEEISIARENYGLEMEFQMMYRKTLEEIRELVKGRKNSEGIIRQTITEYLIQNKINEVLR